MELFDSMTVAENIALGCEGGLAGRNPWRLVVSNHQERLSITAMAEEAPVQDTEAREDEEMRMLLLGFGTGILIAFIFLIYIVIAFAGVLP